LGFPSRQLHGVTATTGVVHPAPRTKQAPTGRMVGTHQRGAGRARLDDAG